MELKFTKATDSEHEVELESFLISADWSSGVGYAGGKVGFEVRTALVGQGATIEVKGKSEKGKKLGTVKDKISNNTFIGEFDVPEDIEAGDEIFFEVSLSDNGLDGESARIPVRPIIDVTNIKWSAAEARRGDVLTLTADIKGAADDTEVLVTIMEYDSDNTHDKISEITTMVKDGKIELEWEYEYHEDVDEIPTEEELKKYGNSYNPPEYFFTITIAGEVYGKEQESGILEFKDWIEFELSNYSGKEKYILVYPDGTKEEGKFDDDGKAQIKNVKPGKFTIEVEIEE